MSNLIVQDHTIFIRFSFHYYASELLQKALVTRYINACPSEPDNVIYMAYYQSLRVALGNAYWQFSYFTA